MYTIYADGSPIYVPSYNGIRNEGQYAVINPELTLEVNKAGMLKFAMTQKNVAYSTIKKMTSVLNVYRDGKELFRGRVFETNRDFMNRIEVVCEGALAFLNDYQVRPFQYKGSIEGYLEKMLGLYNAVVDEYKQIKLGVVTVTDENGSIYRFKDAYANLLEVLSDHLINSSLGGYLSIRFEEDGMYLDYLEKSGELSKQVITFGVNLIDMNEYISAADVFTVLIPVGAADKSGKRIGIKSVNDNKDYLVNEAGVEIFGHIEKTIQYDNITKASNLKKTAVKDLENSILQAIKLDINAVDLKLAGYNTEAFSIGQYIRCVSVPHGIDNAFILSKITIPLDKAGSEQYILGFNEMTLTDSLANISHNLTNVADSVIVIVEEPENVT